MPHTCHPSTSTIGWLAQDNTALHREPHPDDASKRGSDRIEKSDTLSRKVSDLDVDLDTSKKQIAKLLKIVERLAGPVNNGLDVQRRGRRTRGFEGVKK